MQKEKNDIKYVMITCCTYKRPQKLETTIKSLFELELPADIKVEILIVDNDEHCSAKPIVEKIQPISGIPIRYAVEKAPGLANVRNKALNTSIEFGATHIAFIDDDEISDTKWILEHIEFYNSQKEIYVSSGPTYVKFDKQYPYYIENNDVFKKPTTKKFGQIRKTCASGNVFFPLDIVKNDNLYFSEKYNFSGGEDFEFFKRVNAFGYKIGWNPKAINYEIITKERANIKWILARKYFNGFAVSQLKFDERTFNIKKAFYIVEKFFTVILNLVISIFSLLLGLTCFLNCCGLTAKNTGKLIGTLSPKSTNYYLERKNLNA